MALILTTGTGREIACDAINELRQTPVLHIHTAAVSFTEAAAIFSDPAETAVMTEAGGETPKMFQGYTTLYSVQQSPFIPGDLLIWLQRPPIEEDEK